ncbi:MAG: hypothetical protein Q7T34_01845 [Candidatus Parcubacteria bacterium]|nr:hypothetical protein [Candidatus Parcubacteria bacterium]
MQTKKIFDIIPPSEVKGENKVFFKEGEKQKNANLNIRKWKFPLLLALAVPFILALLAYVFIEPKAELLVWPSTQMKEFEVQATIDGSIKEIDLSRNFIPGKIITVEETVSQEFSSTGKLLKEGKAGGTIKIYNAYSTSPQGLVVKTRFISADGKLFTLTSKTNVPGEYYENGKLVPGTVDAEVIASSAGEEYNIEPTIFSIPGFAGTPKYTSFYAKSFSPMQGGFKKEVSQVSQADINNAEKMLSEKALEQSLISLANKAGKDTDVILSDELTVNNLIDTAFLANAGQELEIFPFQAKANAESLSFKKSDLSLFSEAYALNQISSSFKLQTESLKISYLINKKLSDTKAAIDLVIQARIYPAVSEDTIKDDSLGKGESQFTGYIENNYKDIEKVQVKLWPFWVKTIPLKADNVKVTVVLPPVGE